MIIKGIIFLITNKWGNVAIINWEGPGKHFLKKVIF